MIAKILLCLVGCAIFAVSKLLFSVLVVALLPFISTIFMSKLVKRNVAACISALNIAGVAPFVADMFLRNPDEVAHELLFSAYFWGVVYGAVVFSLIIIWLIPNIVHFITSAIVRTKITELKSRQDKLIKEWGPEVNS